jgi:hypothetical protein
LALKSRNSILNRLGSGTATQPIAPLPQRRSTVVKWLNCQVITISGQEDV